MNEHPDLPSRLAAAARESVVQAQLDRNSQKIIKNSPQPRSFRRIDGRSLADSVEHVSDHQARLVLALSLRRRMRFSTIPVLLSLLVCIAFMYLHRIVRSVCG